MADLDISSPPIIEIEIMEDKNDPQVQESKSIKSHHNKSSNEKEKRKKHRHHTGDHEHHHSSSHHRHPESVQENFEDYSYHPYAEGDPYAPIFSITPNIQLSPVSVEIPIA